MILIRKEGEERRRRKTNKQNEIVAHEIWIATRQKCDRTPITSSNKSSEQ